MRRIAPALGILLSLGVLAGVLLMQRQSASADIVPGEYSMEINIAETSVPVGGTFTVDVGIFHEEGAYQAAQWAVDYPESLVDPEMFASAADIRVATAPGECITANDNNLRILLGCISLSGPTITYSGTVWSIEFTCLGAGVADFSLLAATTFVRPNLTGTVPVHLHGDSVTCGAAVPTATNTTQAPTSTPTATSTTEATATPTFSPTPGTPAVPTDTPTATATTGAPTATATTGLPTGTATATATTFPVSATPTNTQEAATPTNTSIPATPTPVTECLPQRGRVELIVGIAHRLGRHGTYDAQFDLNSDGQLTVADLLIAAHTAKCRGAR